MSKLTPTPEQLNCKAVVKENGFTKITAGAGAAKTTTLSMIAEDNVVPSLYLAFNKAMATEAGSRFPNWVKVQTTHSLAYAQFGSQLRDKLKRPVGPYRNVCGTGSEIARYFKIKPMGLASGNVINANAIGMAVRDTVNRFEYSGDFEMKEKHVSFVAAKKVLRDPTFTPEFYRHDVLMYAKQLWELRTNPRSEILATHDTYLKLYQLSKPNLSKYEIIYLDEAQDTNECVIDIILRQKDNGCKIVVVGDKFQQIYAWRGSVNAMEKFDCAEAFLTTSFRFGPEIARVANVILDQGESFILKGWDQLDTKIMAPELVDDLSKLGQHTRLYRTNSVLIMDAVDLIEAGHSVKLEIDIKDFLRMLESAVALAEGDMKNVKHEEIVPYNSWGEMRAEAELSQGELGRLVRIIEEHRHYTLIGVLTSHRNREDADIIMTTAHKSKGREWDVVVLAEDYASGYNKDGEWVGFEETERNLLYVAVTRAKKTLVCNTILMEALERDESSQKATLEMQAGWIKAFVPGNFISEDSIPQSKHAAEVQDDLDMREEDEVQSAYNVDGSLRLMPDLESRIEQQMMAFGSGVITDLDRFVLPDLNKCDLDGYELDDNGNRIE